MAVGKVWAGRKIGKLFQDWLAVLFAHAFKISNPDGGQEQRLTPGFRMASHASMGDRWRIADLLV